MTPLQFKKSYHAIPVPVVDRKVAGIPLPRVITVCVHKYHLYSSGKAFSQQAMAARSKLNDAQKKQGDMGVTNEVDGRVYYGKGSPRDIAQVLTASVALGLIEPTQAALQQHCDDCIGVDCSGFVNSYWRTEGLISDQRSIASHHKKAHRTARKHPSEIMARDMLVWCFPDGRLKEDDPTTDAVEYGHIALVDLVLFAIPASLTPAGSPIGLLRAVESTGQKVGICESYIRFKEAKKCSDYKKETYFLAERLCFPYKGGSTYRSDSYIKVVPFT